MSVLRNISDKKIVEKQLRHTERMTGIGEMATGMAHEINQPLNTISLSIDNILFSLENNTLTEEYLKTKLNKVFDKITRIRKIIDHVRTFSRDQDDFTLTYFDVNESIKNAISMISEQLAQKEIDLVFDPGENIPELAGNGYRFEQVMLNLMVNAKDAIEEKKKKSCQKFKKKVEVHTTIKSNHVLIEVKDNGTGIPPHEVERVLLPFYTTKAPGQGTGLGLSVSYGIVKELGGDISIKSEVNVGTAILIKIPVIENKSRK
jgi:signal transduction histidine kinase